MTALGGLMIVVPLLPRVEVACERVSFDLVQSLRLAMWHDLTLEEGVRAVTGTVVKKQTADQYDTLHQQTS